MYAGPPLPPEPHLYMFSATTIQLSWLPPFSWAEYPIVNCSVQVYNRATGEVTNSFINATSEMFSTAAPVTFIHNTPHRGVVQNCEELVFIVSAASIIGWGSPAIVTGGFPINCIPVLFSFLLNRDAHYSFLCFVFIECSLMGYNKNKYKTKAKDSV